MLKSVCNIRSTLFFFVLLFSPILCADNSHPELYFVSLYFTNFKTNLNQLHDNSNRYKMILLVNQNKQADLTLEQKKAFHSIFALKNFNFQEIKEIIEQVKK